MEAIDTLILRVAERIEKMGITERAASIEATNSPDAIRYIRTRRAMPSASRLAAIAKVLEATPEWLIGEADINIYTPQMSDEEADAYGQRAAAIRRAEIEAHDAQLALPSKAGRNLGIPIYATSRLPDGKFGMPEIDRVAEGEEWHIPDFDEKRITAQQIAVEQAEVIGHFQAALLSEIQAQSAYGIYLPVNALDPAFPTGTPALASRTRHAQQGDIALFHLWRPEVDPTDPLAARDTVVVPARIRYIYADSYDVDQPRGADFNIPVHRISRIHRIYTMADLLR